MPDRSDAPDEIHATLTLTCPHGPLRVRAVRGAEALSRPFSYEIDVAADTIDLDAAVGASAHLRLRDTAGRERHVHGVVDELAFTDGDVDAVRLRLTVKPAAAQLAHRHGYRIHQEMTVPDVVRKVLRDAGLADELFRWSVGTYPRRTYLVQYGESEWDFISRLLEEEGISYAWEHGEERCVMAFFDANGACAALDEDALRYDDAGATHGALRAWGLVEHARATERRAVLNDYNYETPDADLLAQHEIEDSVDREWYEPWSRYGEAAQGRRLARARIEGLRQRRHTFALATNALAAQCGRTFELLEHEGASGDYVIVGTQMHLRLAPFTADEPLTDVGALLYALTLTVVPKEVPLRPERRTPRPTITGLQTARVTGPSGEEIHTDALGRVKLQFHWDREGQLDENTSCWVRPSHPHSTGSVFLPRVGWEVLVDFVDGDPDRPVCMGRQYHPLHMPPYPLPAERTSTGHRSASSPGAGGLNEVRMDDTAGAESVEVNTARDVTVVVANNKTARVGNSASTVVGKARSARVGSNESVAVEGTSDDKVGGSQTVHVSGQRAVTVNQSISEGIAGSYTLSVGASEMLQVGNPANGVLSAIRSAAVNAAQGAAAVAASRAQAAVLAPMMPALSMAQRAAGPAAALAGPASGLLGGNHAAMRDLAGPGAPPAGGTSSGAAGDGARGPAGGRHAPAEPASMDPSAMAAGAAGAIVSGALNRALGEDPVNPSPAPAGAGGGGGGAGGGGAGGGGGGGGAAGGGTWGTTVGGSVTENIGALAAINSAAGVAFAITGDSSEKIGAARIELVGGGKSETTGGSKTEAVGVYMVTTQAGISVSAGAAMTVNVAASQRQTIGKGHAMSAEGAVAITAPRIKLEATDSITLSCGLAKVVIDSSGISVEGLSVTIQGGSVEVTQPAISPF